MLGRVIAVGVQTWGSDVAAVGGALIGDAETIAARIAMYAEAGATDLMLGFTDFPDTAMLETFAERVPVLLRQP